MNSTNATGRNNNLISQAYQAKSNGDETLEINKAKTQSNTPLNVSNAGKQKGVDGAGRTTSAVARTSPALARTGRFLSRLTYPARKAMADIGIAHIIGYSGPARVLHSLGSKAGMAVGKLFHLSPEAIGKSGKVGAFCGMHILSPVPGLVCGLGRAFGTTVWNLVSGKSIKHAYKAETTKDLSMETQRFDRMIDKFADSMLEVEKSQEHEVLRQKIKRAGHKNRAPKRLAMSKKAAKNAPVSNRRDINQLVHNIRQRWQ